MTALASDISAAYGFLALSLLLLAVGPLVYEFTRQTHRALAAIDGFALVTVGGLVLLYVLPHAIEAGGIPALVVAVIGFLGPFTLERLGGGVSRAGQRILLWVVTFGFIPHALVDGIALSVGPGEGVVHGESWLGFAVIFHRLPVGMAVWWFVRPNHGARRALLAVSLIGLSTIVGFALGGISLKSSHLTASALVEAFVGGTLLHVFLHRPHGMRDVRTPSRWKLLETMGAAVGVCMFLLLPGGRGSAEEAGSFWGKYAEAFADLALQSAPALLLGYFAAGALAVFLPQKSVAWLRRGRPWTQSLMGAAYGLPLPICSCGVVPIYRSLIIRGVPATAAMAFLVATPELGIESLLLSVPLLGGQLTLLRILCALVVALLVGRLVGRLVPPVPPAPDDDGQEGEKQGLLRRFGRVFSVGFGEVLDETAPWILAGLAVAALIVPTELEVYIAEIPRGLDILILAVAGIPTYICASGATPLAAVLLLKGLSPGAAIALLLTGPATNFTTYGVLSRLHGRKVALQFIGSVILIAVVLGYAVNFLLPGDYAPPQRNHEGHGGNALQWACVITLGGVFLLSIVRQGPRAFLGMLLPSGNDAREDEKSPDHCH
ncbi:MAG: permease [Planctomycetota bacterium]|nr:permease [Planctomycetota bacterium]